MFPPMPSWDGLHPLIIHFPIALLFTAPLLIIAALIFAKHRQGLLIAAFIMMVLGTASTFVAVSTGEAASELAERNPAVNATIEQHEELAELTRTLFLVLTIVFAAIIFGPLLIRKPLAPRSLMLVVIAFLIFYTGGTLALANTAHQGGMLVHEYGVRAIVAAAETGLPGSQGSAAPAGNSDQDFDDD